MIFKLQQEHLKFSDICVSCSSPETDLVTNFLNSENQSFENVSIGLFIKPGIQERGTEYGECSTRFRGMFNKIPGNVQQDSGECSTRFRGMLKKIPRNVRKDSRECWQRFRGMFKKIPGNVQEDSGECSRGSRGMFKKIPGNVREDSGECWQRFSRMLKKIGRFIMQLNQNRIKGYILKYNQKYAQKLIKTSQMNEHV